MAQVPRRQGEADLAFLPGLQAYFLEPAQGLGHPAAGRRGPGGVTDVKLHHFRPRHGAAVADAHPQRGFAVFGQGGAVQRGVPVHKAGVAQPVAERPAHGHAACVVPAVPHKNALPVVRRDPVAGVVQVTGGVLQPQGPGLGQTARGVGVAPQQGVGCFAHALPGQIHAQHGRNIFGPGALHRRAGVQYHHGVFLHGGHAGDQVVLAVRQAHMAAVGALALKKFRQSGKDHGYVGALGRRHRAQEFRLVPLVAVGGESRYILHGSAPAPGSLQRTHGPAGVHVAGTAALETRRFGKGADVGHLLPGVQRQRAQVAQQYGAFLRQFHGQRVPVGRAVLRRGAGQVGGAQHDVQNARCRFVQRRLVQRAAAHRFHQARVVHAAGARHLQVQSRGQALYPVVDRAPVGHREPREAPAVPQKLRQQLPVLAGVYAVDPVVAAHQRPGPALPHRRLKGGQVDLVQRTLIQAAVHRQAAGLLVVGGKVLGAGGHALPLHALDEGGGQFPGQEGVLAVIFKVAAAQRAALDVDGGAQHHLHPGGPGFPSQRCAHAAGQRGVKAGRRRAPGGVAHRLDAVVGQAASGFLGAQAVRAVGHHHGRDAQAFHRFGAPEIPARAQPRFFFQRQGLYQFFDRRVHGS